MRWSSSRSLFLVVLLSSAPALARHPVTSADAARVDAEERAEAQAEKEAKAPKPKPREGKDIVQTLQAAKKYKTLLTALEETGLIKRLQGLGPFTLFAPDDAAFRKLPKKQLKALLHDKDKLKDLLEDHILNEAKTIAELQGMSTGSKLDSSGEDSHVISVKHKKVKIDKANVSTAQLKANNGIIHPIDAVLVPGRK